MVIVCRDPYAWLPSFHRLWLMRGATGTKAPEEFVREPVKFQSVSAENPLQYWNTLYRGWAKAIHEPGKLFAFYLDALAEPRPFLLAIKERFSLERKREDWYVIDWEMGPINYRRTKDLPEHYPSDLHMGNGIEVAHGFFDRREHYLNQLYMDWWTDGMLAFARESLDRDLMDALKYEVR